jgi:hypothetical protein
VGQSGAGAAPAIVLNAINDGLRALACVTAPASEVIRLRSPKFESAGRSSSCRMQFGQTTTKTGGYDTMTFLKPFAPQLLSLLRFMSGLLVLQHGTSKYLNFPAGPMNNASPMTMSGAAGVIELIGGILLVIGLFTRPPPSSCPA